MMLLLLLQATQNAPPPVSTAVINLAAWVALGFLGLMGIAILYYVFTGKIDLSGLISEPSGEASMSRFQLLIFTFVIAASFFLIVVTKSGFPDPIPQGVLVLLGISASSYLVSKGIQASSKQGLGPAESNVTVKASQDTTTLGGQTIQFQADVAGLSDGTVIWTLDPPTGRGTIDQTGLYTPPPKTQADAQGKKVVIQAAAKEDVSVKDTVTIELK
jgi:hypothetical protein